MGMLTNRQLNDVYWDRQAFAIVTSIGALSCAAVLLIAYYTKPDGKGGVSSPAKSTLTDPMLGEIDSASSTQSSLADDLSDNEALVGDSSDNDDDVEARSKVADGSSHVPEETASVGDRDRKLVLYVWRTVFACSSGWSLSWFFVAVEIASDPSAFADLPAWHIICLLGAFLAIRVGLYALELTLIHLPTYLLAGFRKADFRTVIGPRHGWTKGTVEYFLAEYGERRIKVADAICRRSTHIINNFLMQACLVPWFCPGAGTKLVAQQLLALVVVAPMTQLIRREGWVGSIFFVGSRIRDGRYGRLNKLNVKSIALITFPVSTLLLQALARPADDDLKFLMTLAAQPLLWGDAMAEIIGSFFGRIQFQVSGVGEVNKKTVEGCIACWASCFGAGWAVMSLPDFPLAHMHSSTASGRTLVLAVQATVATLMETFTFRSYDNLSIVISSAVIVSLFYRL